MRQPMLIGLSILFIISSSVLATNNNASSTIVTDNNMAESSLSPHSTNETHNVNQSSMDMTAMMTKMMERSNIAMGFNQNKIAHRFAVTPCGGSITITSLNSNDTQTINQIKTHIVDIQEEFSKGNFTKPFFIHAQEVPGTDVMTKKKDLIRYNILELRNGS